MKVSVVGQGYVGLPLALALANSGHNVDGIDMDQKLVDKISSGLSPIVDITDVEVSSVVRSGKYSISTNFESVSTSEIVVICVPTPLNDAHQPNLSFLVSAANSISKSLQKGTLVINESTVSPGTTRGLIKEILDKADVDYDLAYSPERIDPANKKWNVTNTPKLVSGLNTVSRNFRLKAN